MLAFAARCTDAAAVAGARAAVEAACDCAAATSNGAYVRCATAVLKSRVDAGTLPKTCMGTVKKCAAQSSCGRPGMVACCLPRRDGTSRCKATTPAKCDAGGGCASAFASCCDACAGRGCAVPTTTTTTTLAPVCGNGIIEGNEQCDGGSACNASCGIVRHACCEIGEAPDVCSVAIPLYTFVNDLNRACEFAAGGVPPWQYRVGLVPSSTPCPGAPSRAAGACVPAPPYAAPVTVCRRLSPSGCEAQTFTDGTALSEYLWTVQRSDPTGWDVVLGTCTDGTCVPAN